MSNEKNINYFLVTTIHAKRYGYTIRPPYRPFHSLSAAQKAMMADYNTLREAHKVERAVLCPLPMFLQFDVDEACYEWTIIPAAAEDATLMTPDAPLEEPEAVNVAANTEESLVAAATEGLGAIKQLCSNRACVTCPIMELCNKALLSKPVIPALWEI